MIQKRVVVTGVGMVSSLGHSVKSSWKNLLAGKSGIQKYLNDKVLMNDKPYNLALVKDFNHNTWKVPHADSRMNNFLWCATHEAIQQSAIKLSEIDLNRAGICLGTLSSNNTKIVEYFNQSHKQHFRTINRLSMLQVLTNIPAATLNVKYQFKGPSMTVSTACASGLSAIIEGMKLIKLSQADLMIVGGTEDVYNPLYLNSSIRLQAMSTKAYDSPEKSSRPFDKYRSGFILGEGSGVLILESLEHALNRKAQIIAEIVGYGNTSDGFSLVRPEPTGNGQVRAMRQAISMAGIIPQAIDHINVHATSTPAGDEIQANAILQIFGKCTIKPSVSAIKSSIGHTFASAGAIQTIFALKSLQQSIAPKILNLEKIQIEGINYARQNIKNEITTVLKNSFGFGGINASAVFKKYLPN